MQYVWVTPIVKFNGELDWINVFGNTRVRDSVESYLRKYVRAPSKYKKGKGFEGLKEDIRLTLMSMYWSRSEFEFAVKPLYPVTGKYENRVDIYELCEHNLDSIVHELIRQHREQLRKEKKHEKDI